MPAGKLVARASAPKSAWALAQQNKRMVGKRRLKVLRWDSHIGSTGPTDTYKCNIGILEYNGL